MPFDPTWQSVRKHEVPEWFHDAKLGIFVHWGLYSVPAWAPVTGELEKVVAEEGWEAWFARNPYAEWYLNSIRIPGSPSSRYHAEIYGTGFSYDDLVPMFNEAVEAWDPDEWAALFGQVGARYAVLTTKHHDGFLLWPSRHPNPHKKGYHTRRDLVGDLAQAVRAHGMRYGLYYSGGLDWTFNDTVITSIVDFGRAIPQQPEYVRYADDHWYELIERYEPVVLWNDIAYPAAADLPRLFAHYYNTVSDGLVNDRFRQRLTLDPQELAEPRADHHFDFTTPEYATYEEITEPKWEATRGIGYSFGYNRNEGPEQYLSVEEMVHSFVDIVSKNGNLLLNVGPMADGTIPDLQRERLAGLGTWLGAHGEAIFETRPWVVAEGTANGGVGVRFTQRSDALYATLLAEPSVGEITLERLWADEDTQIRVLGREDPLPWTQTDGGLTVTIPAPIPDAIRGAPAHTLKISPQPRMSRS